MSTVVPGPSKSVTPGHWAGASIWSPPGTSSTSVLMEEEPASRATNISSRFCQTFHKVGGEIVSGYNFVQGLQESGNCGDSRSDICDEEIS